MRPHPGYARAAARGIPGRALVIALGLTIALALTALAVLANAALFAMAACAAPLPERFTLPGDRIEICDLAGEVRLVRGSGPATEVIVTRGGRDAGRLRIETSRSSAGSKDQRSALRVLYPERRIVYPRLGGFSRSTFSVGRDGCIGNRDKLLLPPHRVTVTSHGRGLEAWADLEVRLPPGRDVTLHLGVGEVSASGIDDAVHIELAAASVRAEDTRGSLSVDAGSGSVTLLRCEGDLEVDTGSGAVRLQDLKGGGVNVDTGSGQVTGGGIEADALMVDTGSGHIGLEGVGAREIRLDTGSGSVRIGLDSGPDRLVVDTGSGSVTIEGPASLGAALEIDTGSGGIESDYPMTLVHRGEGSLEGTIGDGRGRIRVDTGSGSVRLVRR